MAQTLNRTLFISDNLPILRGIDSESIDLIATDPPFNKGVKAFEGITAAGENVSYSDVWTWGDVQVAWTNKILVDHPALYNVIQAANSAAGDDMGAFLCWLGVRVLEMHRVLKPTGSLYLHIDHTAHAYAKLMLDAIFGKEHFRREIVWDIAVLSGFKTQARNWIRGHDTILFYTKSKQFVFNKQSQQHRKEYLDRFNKKDDEGRKYFDGRGERRYLDDVVERGKAVGDVWSDIMSFQQTPTSRERVGYPTQKPLALYERIIKASSNPDDIILDPFAGCATTCVAAERQGRQWVGVDVNAQARNVIHDRLQREVSENLSWGELVRTPSEPPTRTDGGDAVAPELVIVSRKRGAPRLPVREIRKRLMLAFGQRCQGCGWEPPYEDYLHVDHKKPRSLGGEDEMENLTLLCEPCNRLKSNKLTLVDLRQAREEEGRMDKPWWDVERWR